MSNFITLQLKSLLMMISLLILSTGVNANHRGLSTLLEDLQDILSEAEAVNALLGNVALSNNDMCEKLLQSHNSIHKLHDQVEDIISDIDQQVLIENEAYNVLDGLSSTFLIMATHNTDLSVNSTAIKCVEDIKSYNEGINTIMTYTDNMTSILGIANDIGAMAQHTVEISDKLILKSDNKNNRPALITNSLSSQNKNLKLIQALNLVAQRNSLASVSGFKNAGSAGFGVQLYAGQKLSSHAASTFLTSFNMAREWGHLITGVEGLVDQCDLTNKRIKSILKNRNKSVGKQNYIAMTEMSNVIRSVAAAVEKMAITTERLAYDAKDEVLRDSVGSMMEITTQIVYMAENVKEMADMVLLKENKLGLSADQLIAAKELHNVNYKTTMTLVESAQEKAVHITKINSL